MNTISLTQRLSDKIVNSVKSISATNNGLKVTSFDFLKGIIKRKDVEAEATYEQEIDSSNQNFQQLKNDNKALKMALLSNNKTNDDESNCTNESLVKIDKSLDNDKIEAIEEKNEGVEYMKGLLKDLFGSPPFFDDENNDAFTLFYEDFQKKK